ncbi:G-protein coupled receptor 52-like [Apostichopus japonicus]|uniref:G-protein coupled receptor 52-like n=1 Tax=Stichopus japonicus TaxID=307972 RepID=UPI003AB3B946
MSNPDNASNSSSLERLPGLIVAQTSFIVVTSLLILVGNVINIVVLHSSRLWHHSTTVLLKNLSVVDCCIGLSFTVLAVYPSAADLSEWPYGDAMCTVTSFIGGTCCGASVITLALISVDRYFIILRPMDYRRHLTPRKTYLFVALSWIIPAGLHAMVLLGKDSRKVFSYYNEDAFLCSVHYSEIRSLTAVLFFFIFVPTNLVTIAAYCPIIRASLRHSKLIRLSRLHESSAAAKKDTCFMLSSKSNKAVLTLLIITVVFNLCWAPTAISVSLEAIGLVDHLSRNVEFICAWLAMSNSFSNSFVYLVMNSKYRKAVKKLFQRNRIMEYFPQHTPSTPCLNSILNTHV